MSERQSRGLLRKDVDWIGNKSKTNGFRAHGRSTSRVSPLTVRFAALLHAIVFSDSYENKTYSTRCACARCSTRGYQLSFTHPMFSPAIA